jgi:hypothetical protein
MLKGGLLWEREPAGGGKVKGVNIVKCITCMYEDRITKPL